MATVVSSTSGTIISILTAIQNTASASAKIIDTATSSIDMLDSYVQRAKSNQRTAHTVEDAVWQDNLINQAAEAQEAIETALHNKYSNDPARAERFNAISARLTATLNPVTA